MAEPAQNGAVLVTGGAGFVGSHVVRELIGAGARVRVLDAFDHRGGDPDTKWRALADWVREGAIELEVGDVRDPAILQRALRDVTRVVHLAAATGARASEVESAHYLDVNGVGSIHLLEAAVAARVDHVVLASSASVYGRGVAGPAKEDDPLGVPTSAYGLGKATMERAGAWMAGRTGLRVTCTRIFSVYGPGQPATMAVARFRAAVAAGTAFPVLGGGTARRSFTWVGDSARGLVAALGRQTPGFRVYNLANAQSLSVLELASLVARSAGLEARFDHAPSAPGDHDTERVDVSRARAELDFVASTSLPEGLRQLQMQAASA